MPPYQYPTSVYPRVCGGTICRWKHRTGRRGSIPASAGEPGSAMCSLYCATLKVYPRVCGGTPFYHLVVRSILASAGERISVRNRLWPRSIPASAGEPTPKMDRRLALGQEAVYPRVCGGTNSFVYPHREEANHERSIPASAGEPQVRDVSIKCPNHGLSPRLRGNPGNYERSTSASDRVYPRVCGGTNCMKALWARSMVCGGFRKNDKNGLSPRLRGNRYKPHPRHYSCYSRSIPASAGEPYP